MRKVLVTEDEVKSAENLSDLMWKDEHRPRRFSFHAYTPNGIQNKATLVAEVMELLARHQGWNIRIETDIQGMGFIQIGLAIFDLGHWNFGFTEALVKEFDALMARYGETVKTYVDAPHTDGVGMEVGPNLEVSNFWVPCPG